MIGLKNKIILGSAKIAGLIPSGFLQQLCGEKIFLPFYHTISDKPVHHIKYLYDVKGIKAFIQDLDFLLQYHIPIGYKEFCELNQNQLPLKKTYFMLSFDDGLSEFYDIIAPILLRKGVPAVCFLNSAFIDNKDLFYRYKASLLIHELKNNPQMKKHLESYTKNRVVEKYILSINYLEREKLDHLASLINYDFSEYLKIRKPYLSSEQIQTLSNQGFYFGAHSIDHPEYRFIEYEEQIRQTQESITFICNKFSIKDKIFSFPFNDYKVKKFFFSDIKKLNIADNTFACRGIKKDTGSNYQRIPFEMKALKARQIYNAELMYYLLKTPFGKNIVKRND